MSACLKCNSQDTKYVTGVSKKNGKPWAAYKCADCAEMNWVPIKKTNGNQNPMTSLEKKVDQILAILTKNFGNTAIQKEAFSEEETSPF